MTTQRKIIEELGVSPKINPEQEIRTRVNFLKEYLKQTGADGYILGISGGQDSTLAGRLAQIAVTELRNEVKKNYVFSAVRLPYGVQRDEEDAQLALQFIAPDESVVFNIKTMTDAAAAEYEIATGSPISDYDKGNVKARTRMAAQFLLGASKHLLVIGTDHAAEAVTGFFTKFGDGGADVIPLSGLSKRQGKELLKALGAPDALYLKVPTADLLDEKAGQADETELGITYDQLDGFLEGEAVSSEIEKKIIQRYNTTEHKRRQPVAPSDQWWKVTC